jgi:hypothetical protein
LQDENLGYSHAGKARHFELYVTNVYFRLKTDLQMCEEELHTLGNAIFKGLTDGKITQENHDVLDRNIDKYGRMVSEAQAEKP